ncbi:S-adenosyl-L-methionine-dependent methyltransferase [Xylogone sp. PMI_703]|nr:S-adenosyl-L-methionine-dependent methyltransferase [Xylogone sp. PMI_703]
MASIRSSIYNFIEENGRTYHQFKNGQYLLPNDEDEQNRLDLQHKIWDLMLKDKMYLAPIPAPQRVLDIGTGTGIWAIEFASRHPQAEVIGTDLSPIQPEYVPPNCRFEVDDAEDPWTFGQTFDFIHGRMLFAAFKNPAHVIQQAYDALAPGGYLEMEEVYFKLSSPDNTIKDTSFKKWNEMLVEGAAVLGRDWHCTVKFKQYFIDAGFQDVVEIRQPGPIGPWPKNPDDKLIGLHWMANMLDGINAMSNISLRRGLGMSADEMEELLDDVRKDLRNRKIHSYWPIYVVYGRKPL